MLSRVSPVQLILIGFVMLVIGFVLPFVMVMRIVEPTLLLNFVAYFSSLFGLIIGVIGIVYYARTRGKGED